MTPVPPDERWVSRFTIVEESGDLIQGVPVSRREASLIGRHLALGRRLQRGEISPEAFELIVGFWPRVAGYWLCADPQLMLAVLDVAIPEDWIFEYRHGRRGRRA